MSVQKEIDDIRELYSEWIEMAEQPYAMMTCILAKKVVDLKKELVYWERRLEYEYSKK